MPLVFIYPENSIIKYESKLAVVTVSNPAPIGAFDSGVGGLSILTDIRRLLPNEDLIYLADSAHCPYGVKPVEKIRERVLTVANFLVTAKAKLIVVACNSACVAGLDQVRAELPQVPIVGVEPAIKPAHEITRNGKIGVLATNLTLSGSRFSLLVEKYGAGVEVYTQPAPGLVEIVESGKLNDPVTLKILHQYLDPLMEHGIDTLVLGCTHYPFLRQQIQDICGPEVTILDTGAAVARQTYHLLEQHGLMADRQGPGGELFYTSGDPQKVTEVIKNLWPGKMVQVLKASV